PESQREQDLRALIRQVTGLQDEADPNFQLALSFAWSNFRIYEKFIIHSDLNKAASWKRLTEEFLNASLPSIEEIKTDAHYSILSLLLCLSDSPSNSSYVETP
uniref:Tubulin gamma complex component 5 n=1 Tax=Chinchilla lanigera TaxID=34839 RepID=A0A8C2UQF1_CHILA